MELNLVTSQSEEEVRGFGSDITAHRHRRGYRRAAVRLCVCGVTSFAIGTYTHKVTD